MITKPSESSDRGAPERWMIYTSMHRHVDLRQTRSFDYRPEVHDESSGYRTEPAIIFAKIRIAVVYSEF